MLLKRIILKASHRLNGERSIASVFHILSGTKSIQTLQDAHLFRLTWSYGLLPAWERRTFEETIMEMTEEKHFLTKVSHDVYVVSENGKQWMEEQPTKFDFGAFNGLKYYEIDEIFYRRLLLLIQVLSNQQRNYFSYIPVVDEKAITDWMKRHYQTISSEIQLYTYKIHEELQQLLAHFSDQQAELFVSRLSGYKCYGKSLQQLAQHYEQTPEHVDLLFKQIIHQMLDHLNGQPKQYPLLKELMVTKAKVEFLTQSAKSTYQFIQKNYSIAQIAGVRRLKENTIYDHLVEITLADPTFPIESYVSKEEQAEVLRVAKKINSTRLKEIKNHVQKDISYFKIRMALASASRVGDVFAEDETT